MDSFILALLGTCLLVEVVGSRSPVIIPSDLTTDYLNKCNTAKTELTPQAEAGWAASDGNAYSVPECQSTGAYKSEVCAKTSKTGTPVACWCVSAGGREKAGTRIVGAHAVCTSASVSQGDRISSSANGKG